MGVFWIVFPILVIVFENTVVCYFIQAHFPGRFSIRVNWFINVILVILVSALYTVFLFHPQLWIVDIIIFISFWLLYTILFRKNPWYEKCFWSILVVGINAICAVVVVTWSMYITSATQDAVVFGQGIFRFLLVVSAKILQLALTFYFSKLYIKSKALDKKVYIVMIPISLLCLFINTTILNVGLELGDNLILVLYLAIATLCVMAILMIIYYLYHKITSQSELLLKTQSELQHKALMEQHNDELLKIEANMRSWRHDFHNHLQSLMVMSRKSGSAEMEAYVAKLGHSLGDVEGICHTGWQALDAIVSVKHALAKADGIVVNVTITPIPPVPMSDIDMTNLLGNLFDNAIESCRRVDALRRSIDFSLGVMGNMLCIRISNHTDGTERVEDGRFLTTKADKGLHGLGLASVDRIVAATGGLVQRTHKDGVFTTNILLPEAD